MERKLATVEDIKEIQAIPNADNIVKARVRHWWVVIGKDQFQVGDKCIYFEIDSLLPIYNPMFEGLGKYNSIKEQNGVTGYRIRTVKLRNQISQGLALPYTGDLPIGTDLTEQLGIIKYDPYFDPKIRLTSDNGAEGLFPCFIPKTDEERIQNLEIEELCKYNNDRNHSQFNVTEKLDGTSFTAYKYEGEFKVCSRNLILRRDESSIYWKIAVKYDIENIIPDNFAIQGEIIGEGIQGNPLRIKGQELYVFYMYNIAEGKYDFKNLPLKQVPFFIPYKVTNNTTIDQLIDFANDFKSNINKERQAEGLVFYRIEDGIKQSFKVLNNKYLLKEK